MTSKLHILQNSLNITTVNRVGAEVSAPPFLTHRVNGASVKAQSTTGEVLALR